MSLKFSEVSLHAEGEIQNANSKANVWTVNLCQI